VWHDGALMCRTPQSYAQFIGDSLAEWSIAKNVYVGTRSGWFSCRTACSQETAWSKFVPAGDGLIAFETMEQAVDGIERVIADPAKHRAAAFEIARDYLTPQKVLTKMLNDVYAPSVPSPTGRGSG
jgi:hypothetical protein